MEMERLKRENEVYARLINSKNNEIDGLYKTLEERDDKITHLEQVIINAAIDRYAEVKNV